MKKIGKYILFLFIFLGILFININGVNAVPNTEITDGGSSNNGACSYGIICQYQFCGDTTITNCDFNYQTAIVQVAYRCSGSDKNAKSCTTFTAQTGGCKNDGTSSLQLGFNVNGIGDRAPIDFTDEIYGEETNADPINFAGYFKKNGYVCPPLKVSGSGSSYNANYGGNDSGVIHGEAVGCVTNGQQDLDLQGAACEQTDDILQDSMEEQFDDVADATGINGTMVDVNTIKKWAENNGYGSDINALGDPCSVINGELKTILSSAFWLISIVGIILLVVMTALGFIKAIVASDDSKLKDAFSHLVTRIIVVIILLILPVLLDFIITVINNSAQGVVSIGEDNNIFCDITGGSSSDSTDEGETISGNGEDTTDN